MMILEPALPGEVLKEEFLEPMNVTVYRLSKKVHNLQSRKEKHNPDSREVT